VSQYATELKNQISLLNMSYDWAGCSSVVMFTTWKSRHGFEVRGTLGSFRV